MGLIRDRSRRSAPIKMLICGLFLIGLQAYLAAGSGAAQFVVGFSLKKLLIQVPAGIVAVWIASKIFEFDFRTIGTIAKNIAGITVLAEGVACWIPIPFFSIMAERIAPPSLVVHVLSPASETPVRAPSLMSGEWKRGAVRLVRRRQTATAGNGYAELQTK
jgi:hypothetical protein